MVDDVPGTWGPHKPNLNVVVVREGFLDEVT